MVTGWWRERSDTNLEASGWVIEVVFSDLPIDGSCYQSKNHTLEAGQAAVG